MRNKKPRKFAKRKLVDLLIEELEVFVPLETIDRLAERLADELEKQEKAKPKLEKIEPLPDEITFSISTLGEPLQLLSNRISKLIKAHNKRLEEDEIN